MNLRDDSVCVIMLTYNHEPFVTQAIEGVLMQKGGLDYYLIICDDASSDGTSKICQEYASRYPHKITFIQNEKNLGRKLNFRQVIMRRKGAYVAFCEGDDYWIDPEKLYKQISFLQNNPDFNICFHKVNLLMIDGSLKEDYLTKIPSNVTTINDLICAGNYIHTPSVVFRNNFNLPEWYFDCPIGDYPLYLLVSGSGKIKCFDQTMAVYRYGAGSFTGISSVKRRMDYFLTIYELASKFPDICQRRKFVWVLRREFVIYILMWIFLSDHNLKDLKLIISKFNSFRRY